MSSCIAGIGLGAVFSPAIGEDVIDLSKHGIYEFVVMFLGLVIYILLFFGGIYLVGK